MPPRSKRLVANFELNDENRIKFEIILFIALLVILISHRIKKPSRIFTEGIWNNFINSDIEDDSDGDNDDFEAESVQAKRIRVGSAVLTPDDEAFVESSSDEEEFENDDPDDTFCEGDVGLIWTAKSDIKWCHGAIKSQCFPFERTEIYDSEEEYFSPLTYFMRYIPEPLFDDMVTYTNTYAEQQKANKWRPTDKTEIKQFIGLQIMMGNLKLPRIEMYYGKHLQCKMFTDTIPLYRFYSLRTNIHLIDVEKISDSCTDKFVRVRPLMDSVRKRCLELPLEENLSIDEQMIPLRGRVTKGVKQYVKQKPKIKWGVKNLVLCGKSGLAYDFVVYQGSTTEFDSKSLDTFGSGATMVLHLAKRIHEPGHKLYFDNYFSTFQVFEILLQKKILAAGTIRIDRFLKPPFSSDAEMHKNRRGCCEELVSSNGMVACVKWYDNKCVALASNYVGVGKADTALRYDKSSKQKISINRPQIVREYNINMGGVDLMNQLISYYRISIRSKKWTLRMITHFIDFTIVNSWNEYRIDCEKSAIPKRQVMDLLAFRMYLADQLVYAPLPAKRSSRITLEEVRSKNQRVDKSREKRTDDNIRFDGFEHVPEYTENRVRCKLETCNGKSQVLCSKCRVHLCLNLNHNCYREYHKKS